MEFIKEARHAFGRTALVMSGGGALGSFHLGVVRTLLQHRLLPRVSETTQCSAARKPLNRCPHPSPRHGWQIIAGSSVGSIIGSIIATRTDAELEEMLEHLGEFDLSFFANRSTVEFLRHYLKKGSLQDITVSTTRPDRPLPPRPN